MTQIFKIHEQNPEKRMMKLCIQALEDEKVLLVPSDTGYCYIGSARSEVTHDRFLKLRPGHPKNKPFSLLCRDISQVSQIAHINTQIFRTLSRAWPGPYTFILECQKMAAKILGGPKRTTVGVRISSHPIIETLSQAHEFPLLTTSVTDEDELIAQGYFEKESNIESQQDCWWTEASQICARLPKNMLDIGLESTDAVPIQVSTIIDFTTSPAGPELVRDGGWELKFLS
jgi:tRNA threonylcarbamoyl adenosine modification protein (Sua5/YciO/YrdC/YwlC family)